LTNFQSCYIPERNLIFGGQHEEKDPRVGLKHFGPYHYSTETTTLEKIRLGIIGDKSTIEKLKRIVEMISKPIDTVEANRWLYPPFCGMSKDTKFNCQMELSESWQETITQHDIDMVLNVADTNERIGGSSTTLRRKNKKYL
jgi:hypothetical protein